MKNIYQSVRNMNCFFSSIHRVIANMTNLAAANPIAARISLDERMEIGAWKIGSAGGIKPTVRLVSSFNIFRSGPVQLKILLNRPRRRTSSTIGFRNHRKVKRPARPCKCKTHRVHHCITTVPDSKETHPDYTKQNNKL